MSDPIEEFVRVHRLPLFMRAKLLRVLSRQGMQVTPENLLRALRLVREVESPPPGYASPRRRRAARALPRPGRPLRGARARNMRGGGRR